MRKSVFSGLFYPKEKTKLEKTIQSAFLNLKEFKKKTKAIIAPHAGYIYCQKQLAEAYNCLKYNKFKTAVIIGPSHRHYFKGISVYDGHYYEIPTGKVHINKNVISQLQTANPEIKYIPKAHNQEHSIEVQLPFLKHINNSAEIVPLITGENSYENLEKVADTLQSVIDPDETVFIVSTDFSHFYPSQKAIEMDTKAIELICQNENQKLYQMQQYKKIQLCGIDATIIILKLLNRLNIKNIRHISYAHSGQISKDLTSVVGYNSFCAYE